MLGQKGKALLKGLIEAKGEVVTKDSLMSAAWASAAVEEGNLTVQMAALRKAIAGLGAGGEFILTVPRIGYQLQSRRNTRAAKHLLIRLMNKQGCLPKRIVTDKLRSYGAARRQVMPAVEHRSHKGLNNCAENSHLPLRKRERAMQGFRSPGGLQRFLSVFSAVRNLFVPPYSKHSAIAVHLHRLRAIAHWKAVTGAAA
ncbi:DDE domain-containing protein [Rhizobium leguminosarum bv. viciae]|nr:DDE domain-containing protein [Rhizobium leguminosarum bv. viciae]